MAPEQMRASGAIDARTDVWALGVTLYTLLAGEAPFRGASLIEIHERILEGPPKLRDARPDAPEALEAVLARCMQKDPAIRYATVAELGEALAAFAPEHARVSAQRAARTLAAAPLEGASEEPSTEAGSDGPTTEAPQDPSWQHHETGAVTTGGSPRASRPVEIASRPGIATPWRWPLAVLGAGAVGGLVAKAVIELPLRPEAPLARAAVASAAPGTAPAVDVAPPIASASDAAGRAPPREAATPIPSPRPVAETAARQAAARDAGVAAPPAGPAPRRRDPFADPD
jgi:serine/threonine-protein kinase